MIHRVCTIDFFNKIRENCVFFFNLKNWLPWIGRDIGTCWILISNDDTNRDDFFNSPFRYKFNTFGVLLQTIYFSFDLGDSALDI